MTKPGNSDPAEPTADKDEAVPETDTTSSLAPDPAEPAGTEPVAEPDADADSGRDTTAEPESAPEKAAEPEKAAPSAAGPAPAEPAAEPAAKPAAAKARRPVEKAPPIHPDDEPVMPTAREAAMRAQAKRRFEEPAPRTLRFSFYFFVASGLVWLISMIASLVYKQDIVDATIEQAAKDGSDLTADQLANGVTQLLWIVTIAALTFTVFLGLFGYKATEGTRRARTLVTIFATVLVLFQLLFNGTPPAILSAFLSLTALALLWSPSARRYFAPRDVR